MRSKLGQVFVVLTTLVAALVGPLAPAMGQELDGASEAVGKLSGKNMVLSGEPNPVEDETGDGTDRAGAALPGLEATDIVGADWHDVDGSLDSDALERACAEGLETSDGHVDVVCPEDLTAMIGAERFLYVAARFKGPLTLENIDQFVFLWAEPGLETYSGAPGDLNNDETDSVDLFAISPTDPLQFGRTTFRSGTFGFDAAFTGAVALISQGYIAFLIPHDPVIANCLNVAVGIISGQTIDKAALPPIPSGTITERVVATTTTTIEATTTTQSTAVQQQDPPAAQGDGEPESTPTSTEDDEGGFPTALWVLIGIAVLGGPLAYFLFVEKSENCEEELKQLNAAKARSEASEMRAAEAQRRLAADPNSTALGVEAAEAETTAGRDRKSVEDWQYAYDLCMGFVEPRGAGVSDVPETPSARPMTVIDAPMTAPAVTAEEQVNSQPPTTSESPPKVGAGAGVAGATAAGATTDDDCGGKKFEWRPDKSVGDIWDEPVGTIRLSMSNPPDQFRAWLGTQGEPIHPDTGEIDSEDGVTGTPESGVTLQLGSFGELRDRDLAELLLKGDDVRYDSRLTVYVAMQTVGRHCERKWTCEDGEWSMTNEVRLSKPEFVGEANPYQFARDCTSGNDVLTRITFALQSLRTVEQDGVKKQDALRKKCAGGG